MYCMPGFSSDRDVKDQNHIRVIYYIYLVDIKRLLRSTYLNLRPSIVVNVPNYLYFCFGALNHTYREGTLFLFFFLDYQFARYTLCSSSRSSTCFKPTIIDTTSDIRTLSFLQPDPTRPHTNINVTSETPISHHASNQPPGGQAGHQKPETKEQKKSFLSYPIQEYMYLHTHQN